MADLSKLTRDENGYISGEVACDLSDLIDSDLEGVLDILSEKLTGSELLMDITYRAVRVEDDGYTIVMFVSGDPATIEEAEEED